MDSKTKYILVSIIIVIGDKRERAKGSIESVLSLESIEIAEIIIVDSSANKFPPIQIQHKNQVYISFENRPGIGKMKELAVLKAKGFWIAFLEEHARALPGWLNAIKNLNRDFAGMGGEIYNLNNGEYFSNSLHYCNYYRWLPGTKRRECNYVAGHNSVYRKELLVELESKLKYYLLNESLLNQVLIKNGLKLIIEPEFKIGHINESTIHEIFTSYFNWHRCIGYNSKLINNESRLLNYKILLLLIVKPFYRTTRILFYLLKYQPKRVIHFLIRSPMVFVIFSIACLGEIQGRLFGMEDSDMKLTKMELDSIRTVRVLN